MPQYRPKKRGFIHTDTFLVFWLVSLVSPVPRVLLPLVSPVSPLFPCVPCVVLCLLCLLCPLVSRVSLFPLVSPVSPFLFFKKGNIWRRCPCFLYAGKLWWVSLLSYDNMRVFLHAQEVKGCDFHEDKKSKHDVLLDLFRK